MDALRQKWLDTVVQWRLHPDAPANDHYWAPELDTCPRERLKDIQNAKLEVLIPYLLEYSPFYRHKFQQAKLTARDIQSVDDLYKIPPTTKMEMVTDVAANPPWGTYLAIDDQIWKERAAANPAKRYGDPKELGALCAFLCSSNAGYITGQSLVIDGGSYPGTY